MQLTIKYFGMLAETTKVSEEKLHTDTCTVAQLVEKLKQQYPKLNDTDFKIAIDQQLVGLNHNISTEAEVALLPPFAGG